MAVVGYIYMSYNIYGGCSGEILCLVHISSGRGGISYISGGPW